MPNNKFVFDCTKMFNLANVTNETRENPYKIVKACANITVCLNSFSHRMINNWNNLASEIVCAESVTIFKTRLDKSHHDDHHKGMY